MPPSVARGAALELHPQPAVLNVRRIQSAPPHKRFGETGDCGTVSRSRLDRPGALFEPP